MGAKPVPSKSATFIESWSNTGFDPDKKAMCAAAAGFSPLQASKKSHKIISSLIQNEKMRKELKRAGVDLKKLAEKIAELLEARNYMAKPIGKNEETGEPIYPPDNFTQLKAVELGTRLSDAMPSTKIDLDKRETKQIVFTAEVVHRLERFEEQRTRMLSGRIVEAERVIDAAAEPAPCDQG